ncbi:MAG: nuclear transport factor 2 family protein [Planctomycetes bacterium]|nr:nuclear transport factor 2 family protein [Planctomycetota bacterium]
MLGKYRRALRMSVVVGVFGYVAIGGYWPREIPVQSQSSEIVAAEPIIVAVDTDTKPEVESIHRLMFDQSDAWNRGDIPAFMEAYWKSPELTFSSGGNVTRSWEATRDRYLERYPDRATMGKLTFSELETRLVGDQAALTLGRWKLERGQPIDGNFSLVWQKFDDGWKIIHDHTSSSTR